MKTISTKRSRRCHGWTLLCLWSIALTRLHGVEAPADVASATNSELLFQVVDAATGQPSAGAQLRVSACDEAGCHLLGIFRVLPVGPVSIRYPARITTSLAVGITQAGFVPKLVTWKPGANDLIDGQYIAKLEPAVTIGGYVRGVDNKGVANVRVRLNNLAMEDPLAREHLGVQNPVAEVVTDGEGRWVCDFAPRDLAKISLRVEHPDFVPATHLIEGSLDRIPKGMVLISRADLLAQRAALVIRHGQTIRGRVMNGAGEPILGARALLGSKFNRPPIIELTDETGHFVFRQRSEPERSVTVQAAGFAPDARALGDNPPPAELEFKLARGAVIMGRVLGEQDRPLAGATVSAGTATWRGDQNLDWSTTTDGEGRFTWDSAPPEGIRVSLRAKGYDSSNLFCPTDGSEPVVKLKPVKEFRGRVVDASTKQPLPEFRVIPGTESLLNGVQITRQWDTGRTMRGRDGEYSIRRDAGNQVLKFEAAGYLPVISPMLKDADLARSVDFELAPGHGPRGVVFGLDGRPVAGAQVALLASGKVLELGAGRIVERNEEHRSPVAKTDEQGRFALPPEGATETLIAVHASGYAEVPFATLGDPVQVRLQPWGRVEGTVRIGNRAGTNESVVMTMSPQALPGIVFNLEEFQAVSDAAGRFVFAQIPPGKRFFARRVSRRPRVWGLHYYQTLEVKPGVATSLTLGGRGRPIIGKVAFALPAEGTHEFRSKILPQPDNLKTVEELMAWYRRPEVQAALWNKRYYPVTVAADGSFRIEDVEPGTYEFKLQSAKGLREVVVSEMPGGRSDEPLDLGVLEK